MRFIATERTVVGKYKSVKLRVKDFNGSSEFDGFWIQEYSPYGSETIHCLPAKHYDDLKCIGMYNEIEK